MNSQKLKDLVREYFRGVDSEDLEGIFQTLNDDCIFTVETHQLHLRGRDQISKMFRRLWGTHKSVQHDRFSFITDPDIGRVAVQFRVTNTLDDGRQVFKSNCNFFDVQQGKFSQINVYMAGENTLDISDSN